MPLTIPTAPDPDTPHTIEIDNGITESWDAAGPEAEVLYRCLWVDRYDLAKDLMGGYRPGAGGFAQFNPPHAYPPSPNLYCVKLGNIKGDAPLKIGQGSKWLPYKYALIPATYRIPEFDVQFPTAAGQIDTANPILYCRQRIRASSAFKVLGKRKLKFSTSGKIVDSEAARPSVQDEITLEFPRLTFNPYILTRPYRGKLNSVEMFGADVGCVLLDSVDTETSGSTDGIDVGATLTYLVRDVDWNTLVNDEGEDELVEFADAPSPPVRPFQYVNHLALFA